MTFDFLNDKDIEDFITEQQLLKRILLVMKLSDRETQFVIKHLRMINAAVGAELQIDYDKDPVIAL